MLEVCNIGVVVVQYYLSWLQTTEGVTCRGLVNDSYPLSAQGFGVCNILVYYSSSQGCMNILLQSGCLPATSLEWLLPWAWLTDLQLSIYSCPGLVALGKSAPKLLQSQSSKNLQKILLDKQVTDNIPLRLPAPCKGWLPSNNLSGIWERGEGDHFLGVPPVSLFVRLMFQVWCTD